MKYGSLARSNGSVPNKLQEEDRKVTSDTEFCHSSVDLGIEDINPLCKDANDREVDLSGSALIDYRPENPDEKCKKLQIF